MNPRRSRCQKMPCPQFHKENFCEELQKLKIRKIFRPPKFPTIWYKLATAVLALRLLVYIYIYIYIHTEERKHAQIITAINNML